MTASPIYDQLLAEMGAGSPETPFCPSCGRAELRWTAGCVECWQKGLLDPDWTEAQRAHHCHDCGEFLRCSFVTNQSGVSDVLCDCEWIIVCAEHFAQRTGRFCVWNPVSIGNIQVVDELPAPAEVFPSIERIAA